MSSSSTVPLMDDSEIAARVSSLAGPHARILDCEKKSSLVTEEVLLLNGVPIRLTGEAGERVKAAMKAGLPPPPEILSEILIRSGIQSAPVQVETVTTVKSNTKTSEVSTLTDSQGVLVDEKMKEFEEDDTFESTNVEVWEKEAAAAAPNVNSIKERLELEKNRMWDFYNSNNPPGSTTTTTPSSPGSRPKPSSAVFTQVTEESSRVSSQKRSRDQEDLPDQTHHYENVHQVPNSVTGDSPRSRSPRSNFSSSPSPPPPPQSFSSGVQRVPTDHEYANVEYLGGMPKAKTRSPGKMPPLSIPSDPNLRPRPPIPPKPAGIRFSPKGYIANLRTDKNLTLPVRVVYETFI